MEQIVLSGVIGREFGGFEEEVRSMIERRGARGEGVICGQDDTEPAGLVATGGHAPLLIALASGQAMTEFGLSARRHEEICEVARTVAA